VVGEDSGFDSVYESPSSRRPILASNMISSKCSLYTYIGGKSAFCPGFSKNIFIYFSKPLDKWGTNGVQYN